MTECPQCGSHRTFGYGFRREQWQEFPNHACFDCKCEWGGPQGIIKNGNKVTQQETGK